MATGSWFVWLNFGRTPAPARGPHGSVHKALIALRNFRKKHGAKAGAYEAAGGLRLRKCSTRAEAAAQRSFKRPSQVGK